MGYHVRKWFISTTEKRIKQSRHLEMFKKRGVKEVNESVYRVLQRCPARADGSWILSLDDARFSCTRNIATSFDMDGTRASSVGYQWRRRCSVHHLLHN